MRRASVPLALLVALAASAASAGAHLMPMRFAPANTANTANAATPHLQYYGGPVLSNVKVVAVNWNNSVNSEVKSKMGDFYTAFTQSGLFDWLSEYNTPASGGTNQKIGHGTFANSYTLSPSHTATTLADSDIQAELTAQINNHGLPPPDANTIYMINFPPGITITMQGSSSCQQFCAYHGTIAAAGSLPQMYYGVLPDLYPPSACSLGCGGSTSINNTTSVASHELIEATTDAAVGLSTSYGPPLAWYDPQGSDGEIGDICNGQQATFQASTGATWTIQKEWSNMSGACIGTSGDAFSLTVSPSSQNLQAGSTTSYGLSSAVTRGNGQNVTLSVSGLPSGVTGSFSPATVSAGQSSTLTLSASSSSTNGSTTFTITGSGSNSTTNASASVTISGGSGGGGCPSGWHEVGGVCVPGGCTSTGSGSLWAAAFALGAFALLRRRKA
jgi:MYXO-CTERM domain-containing protein